MRIWGVYSADETGFQRALADFRKYVVTDTLDETRSFGHPSVALTSETIDINTIKYCS